MIYKKKSDRKINKNAIILCIVIGIWFFFYSLSILPQTLRDYTRYEDLSCKKPQLNFKNSTQEICSISSGIIGTYRKESTYRRTHIYFLVVLFKSEEYKNVNKSLWVEIPYDQNAEQYINKPLYAIVFKKSDNTFTVLQMNFNKSGYAMRTSEDPKFALFYLVFKIYGDIFYVLFLCFLLSKNNNRL